MDSFSPLQLTFDRAATYRIRVRGIVTHSWSARLLGMNIHRDLRDNGPPMTILQGELPDQAALLGVLVALHELHLPVLSVRCLAAHGKHPVQHSFDDPEDPMLW
jgi:hypothetical protein